MSVDPTCQILSSFLLRQSTSLLPPKTPHTSPRPRGGRRISSRRYPTPPHDAAAGGASSPPPVAPPDGRRTPHHTAPGSLETSDEVVAPPAVEYPQPSTAQPALSGSVQVQQHRPPRRLTDSEARSGHPDLQASASRLFDPC
jgi:hypothetical protein